MINGKKVVGLCITRMHDAPRARMLNVLHRKLNEYGIRMIVFNNPFDFSSSFEADNRPAAVYDLINFDYIDALVVVGSVFINKHLYHKTIERAKEKNIPVILENDIYEGCYLIRNNFEDSYAELLNHVIRDHGVRDTFYIAGRKGNIYSEERIAVYRRVLLENGLAFDWQNVDYGDFWDGPANQVMDRLLSSQRKLPQAIFCANDTMAVAACSKLKAAGYRVPEDVIVTGFDGALTADFSEVRISTCVSNRDVFAEKCAVLLNDILSGIPTEMEHEVRYTVRLTDSCGCKDCDKTDYRRMAIEYHKMTVDMIGHEYTSYRQIIRKMNTMGELNAFYDTIAEIIDPGSVLAIRPSYLTYLTTENAVTEVADDEMMLITSTEAKLQHAKGTRVFFNLSDMVPYKEEWTDEQSVYIINPIVIGDMICGYYESRTSNIMQDAQSITRILNLINIVIHMASTDIRQRFLKASRREITVDPLTQLLNLHGAISWYEEFMADPENVKKAVAVSVYCLPKYQFLCENYGIGETEAALCFVAEALKLINTSRCMIAHSADDTFLVFNYYDRFEEIEETINDAVDMFFKLLGKYNDNGDRDYSVEVQAGCTQVESAQGYKLETLLQMATVEMYHNRMVYGGMNVKEQVKTSKEQYVLFSTLITKNQFLYHFQPIVRADNGEIVAYEALMRTEQNIGLNPLQVLQIATEYNRLYDVEKATIFNVMNRYRAEKDRFLGRKIYVNCIPGYSLKAKENEQVCLEYADLIDQFVFEITERDTVTDEELARIRSLGNANGRNAIAIDDYGTGHSNIVNLISYMPEIVKIDRFLITDIHKEPSKQMMVMNTVEFARMQGIKVLAEGVETEEELRKVIELGVDYIQGYFTGRPSYEPVERIDEKVVQIICDVAQQG